MAASLQILVFTLLLANGWLIYTVFGQVSPAATDTVQTSTVLMTQTTSVTPTFTYRSTLTTPAVTTAPSEIASYDITVTIVSIQVGQTVIDASNPDVFDPTTAIFIAARNTFIAVLTAYYQADSVLSDLFLGILFNSFIQGSIIADYTVQFKKNITAVTQGTTANDLTTNINLNPVFLSGSNSSVTFVPNTVNVGDFNECSNATTNNCHQDATCLNTLGSFTCACNSGMTGDGFSCTSAETDRTVLYIMIGVVVLLVFLLCLFIAISIIRRREKRQERAKGKSYPTFDFTPGASTPSDTAIPRAKSLVLPPVTSSEKYRFYYRNVGWDDN